MALSLFLLLDNLSSPKPHAALSLSKVVSVLIITNTIITTTITIIYVLVWSNHPPGPYWPIISVVPITIWLTVFFIIPPLPSLYVAVYGTHFLCMGNALGCLDNACSSSKTVPTDHTEFWTFPMRLGCVSHCQLPAFLSPFFPLWVRLQLGLFLQLYVQFYVYQQWTSQSPKTINMEPWRKVGVG